MDQQGFDWGKRRGKLVSVRDQSANIGGGYSGIGAWSGSINDLGSLTKGYTTKYAFVACKKCCVP